jgi:hypothetical protein
MRIANASPPFEHLAPESAAPPRDGGNRRTFSLALGERAVPPAAPLAGRAALGLLARAADSERAIDGFVRAAASGRTFTPGQLLAVQATVARYGQTVEVVSRAADRLVGAVKQTLGTQV